MVKSFRILLSVALLAVIAVGCSHDDNPVVPTDSKPVGLPDKNGTEELGNPEDSGFDILAGSGFAVGGVGMVGANGGARSFEVIVPDGATVNQAILYWSGGTTAASGDNTLTLNTTIDITGDLIGGPAYFFGTTNEYFFYSYRFDITSLDLIGAGTNTLTVQGMEFEFADGDENNGVGVLVIYSDGTSADIQLRDGLDLAHFRFTEPRTSTIPQTFTFPAESEDRVAQMPIFAGSVGVNRPNEISVITNGPNGDMVTINDPLGSNQGALWDAVILNVTVPAEATELTVELISPVTLEGEPIGASMSWVAGGLAVPETPDPETYCIGDYVWNDMNRDGCQDATEMGLEGVTVNLWTGCPPEQVIDTTVTDADGYYDFCELEPGAYTVQFVAPDDYVFTEQFSDGCDTANDSNADAGGISDCITIVDADDYTIDAGMFVPPTYCIGDFVWYDENSNGCQDVGEMGAEGVEVNLWSGCPPAEVIFTTYTNAEGYYEFCELEPGDYTVQFVAPGDYFFCEQYSGDCDPANDSNAGEDGITDCITIVDADDRTIDAALCEPPQEGCTLTIGYWKSHAGEASNNNGNQDDMVTPLLPVWLGTPNVGESVEVTTNVEAVRILSQHYYGRPSNGITKLRAQLLGAKLNYENGASISDVSDVIAAADAFLAEYSWEDWRDLTDEQEDNVMYWHGMLDDYNNGIIGPGHCDYEGDGEMEYND